MSMEGVIERFDPEDSIGTITLDDGSRVAFGATACKGFLPVVGARVRVTDSQPHPRHGLKAKRVELLDSTKDHHARAAQTYGLEVPTTEQRQATAALFSWVTILLDEPLPESQAELDQLSDRLGLAAHGMRFLADPTGELVLRVGTRDLRAFSVPAPVGEDRFEASAVPEGFDRGRAHLSLSLGMPEVARKMRALNPETDPGVEVLTTALRALCPLGPGVILDLAEGLLIPSDDFLELSTESERPERLFSALAVGHDERFLRSRGMAYFGAFDAAMGMLDSGIDETASIVAGLCRDLATGWQPTSGQELIYEIGGRDLSFRMLELGAGWWLEGQRQDEMVLAHHAGMWLAAAERLQMRRLGYLEGISKSAPHHYVDVFSGLGSAMVTNGLSLAPQPGGSTEHGNGRVELMVYLDRHGPAHARMLSFLGGMLFEQGGKQPFRPWDGIRNPLDAGFPAELELFIVVPREPLVIWPGHEAQLFQLVAVGADEYGALRGNPEAGARWLEERKQARDFGRYHARFNALLAR